MNTRDRIIDCAIPLFWRMGYHPVSTEALCRAAGIRKSSLYHAFPSKAHILVAALEAVWTRNWSEILQCYEGDSPIDVKFERHLAWFATSQLRLRDEHGIMLGTFDMALGVAIPTEVSTMMLTHQVQHNALLRASVTDTILRRGGNPKIAQRASEMVGYLILAANVTARLGNDLEPLERLPPHVFELLDAMSGMAC